MRQSHDPRYLLSILGKDNRSRPAFIHPCVVLIEHEVFRTVKNSFLTGNLPELA
jgi:hypothetical protein